MPLCSVPVSGPLNKPRTPPGVNCTTRLPASFVWFRQSQHLQVLFAFYTRPGFIVRINIGPILQVGSWSSTRFEHLKDSHRILPWRLPMKIRARAWDTGRFLFVCSFDCRSVSLRNLMSWFGFCGYKCTYSGSEACRICCLWRDQTNGTPDINQLCISTDSRESMDDCTRLEDRINLAIRSKGTCTSPKISRFIEAYINRLGHLQVLHWTEIPPSFFSLA